MPDIASTGATLVGISPQLPVYLRTLAEQKGLSFPLLGDRGNEVARRYGLTFTLTDALKALHKTFGTDLQVFNGDASWELPMPARFIVDSHGTIRAVHVDPDFSQRLDPAHTVATLRAMMRDPGPSPIGGLTISPER